MTSHDQRTQRGYRALRRHSTGEVDTQGLVNILDTIQLSSQAPQLVTIATLSTSIQGFKQVVKGTARSELDSSMRAGAPFEQTVL